MNDILSSIAKAQIKYEQKQNQEIIAKQNKEIIIEKQISELESLLSNGFDIKTIEYCINYQIIFETILYTIVGLLLLIAMNVYLIQIGFILASNIILYIVSMAVSCFYRINYWKNIIRKLI